jgi:hypothetical protein
MAENPTVELAPVISQNSGHALFSYREMILELNHGWTRR